MTIEWEGFKFLTQDYDCLVSPANSFGLMDGGADYSISFHLAGGPGDLVPHVQKALMDRYAGQQPVGTSFLIGVSP